MSSTIHVYNTLGRVRQPMEPVAPGKVGMYVCGPTVQSEPHLGHGRFAVVFDMVRRYLEWRGYTVTYVRNITDVEDKIIAAATAAGETMTERAERMTAAFHAVFDALAVLPPDVEPRATEHIPDMIEMIESLIERGLAYPAENGDVYFSVRALELYGKLSGRNVDELRAGARVEVSEIKNDPLDFALWKAAKPGEPAWDSPWGPGRPGWHIECSAMARRHLGPSFDIHGGGTDLIFPHHENEIAQSEGANGVAFARYWLHNGMVNLGGEKMSKSTGHVIDLREAIDRHGGLPVRLVYLRAHYRSPLEFSEPLVADAEASLERIVRTLERAPRVEGVEPDADVIRRFTEAMDEDFGTPEALGVLFDSIRELNRLLDDGGEAPGLAGAVHEMVDVLGLRPPVLGWEAVAGAVAALATELGVDAAGETPSVLDRLLALRSAARTVRDFATSDRIRDRLGELGIVVEDAADGSRWVRR
jgi:cysteinyl-tRNA synthetase